MSDICSIDGCGCKYFAKGLCRRHYNKQWHALNYVMNGDKVRAKSKAWNDANKEYRSIRDKKYAIANRQRKLEYYKKYYINNRDRRIMQASLNAKNRRSIKALTGWHMTSTWWDDLVSLYENKCAYCGIDGSDSMHGHLTIEHVVPLSRGGAHNEDNIVPACQKCNDTKGAKTCDESLMFPRVPIMAILFGASHVG